MWVEAKGSSFTIATTPAKSDNAFDAIQERMKKKALALEQSLFPPTLNLVRSNTVMDRIDKILDIDKKVIDIEKTDDIDKKATDLYLYLIDKIGKD